MRSLFLFFSIFAVFVTSSANGQFGQAAASSSSNLISGSASIAPGEKFTVAVELDHPIGWHSYFINPGSVGMPLTLTWNLPEGFEASEVKFPTPHKSQVPGGEGMVTFYGYEGKNLFLVEISVPDNAEVGTTVNLEAAARWLICDEKGCRPENATLSLSLPVAEVAKADPVGQKAINDAMSHFPQSGDSLAATVTEKDDLIQLEVELPEEVKEPKSAYFYSKDKQVDAQQEQAVEFSDGVVSLTLPRNNGNEASFIEAGPKLATLEGVLVVEAGGKEYAYDFFGAIEGGVEGPASAEAGSTDAETATKSVSNDWTEEEIKEGGELYDENARPEFVLLDGEAEKKLTLLPALGLVFIGGLLLNLMPCVFPVLGLKIMGFVQQAGEDESKVKNHGMVFGLGVLVSMWVLSGIIIAAGVNWGAQLTSPAFVAGIIILLFLMGLNLAGVFEFGTSLTGVGGELQSKKGYSGSFFSGVLTTLIATPCSGPFLGSVMGFALSQKASIAIVVFTFFALGIASPYIVLSFFPKLINKLPKPGAWMDAFKKGMSFALFATVAFFLRSFANQTGYDGLSWLLFALVVIALAAWIYGTWGSPFQKKGTRYAVGYGLTILVAALGIQMTRVAVDKEAPMLAGGEEWKKWFPGAMELSRSKKRIAWIDYTADW